MAVTQVKGKDIGDKSEQGLAQAEKGEVEAGVAEDIGEIFEIMI